MDAQKNGYSRKTKAELIAELEAADRDLRFVTAQNDYKRGHIVRMDTKIRDAERRVVWLENRVSKLETVIELIGSMMAVFRNISEKSYLSGLIKAQNSFKAALK